MALGISVVFIATFVSCNKINLPTELGQELIPTVDNIHTFDTTLEVETYNNIFDQSIDTFKMDLSYPHMLGVINNDPIFGKTDAQLFFQVSPGTYPFKNRPDSLYLDSVVLILDHGFTYGDTLAAQTIQVSEIDPSNVFRYDTTYRLTQFFSTSSVLGSKTIVPSSFNDSIRVISYPDTTLVANQLRIKLNNSFGQRLLSYDSTGSNNAYQSDSIFRTKFKGFAVKSIAGGNALMAMYLTSANTRLAVYYRYNDPTTPSKIDTSVAYFSFYNYSSGAVANANANYIKRDYNGSQIGSGFGDAIKDPIVYIQNTPGTYANVKIPGLVGFPNSVIHLAELQMESIYNSTDTLFYASPNVFLDVYDSTSSSFKLIPHIFGYGGIGILTNYDGFYSNRSASNPFYYKMDPLGNKVKQIRFNLTRYAQKLVSNNEKSYPMRLYAPSAVNLPLGDPIPVVTTTFAIPQSSFLGVTGIGRIRLGGGNHPTQKMKLRVVYSKL